MIEYYTADVVTANDYYPFGMLMPGRKYSAEGKYRYGFNGQEMDSEINGECNSYAAEFWQYDSRLGRRWNIDPVVKEYESPYAAFGNNPVWNIDPNGADTTKYLTNAQLVDALKIASSELKSVLKDKRDYRSPQVDRNLGIAVTNYIQKNDLGFGEAKEFQESVTGYYHGLEAVAINDVTDFEKLDRTVINNKNVNNYWTVKLSVGMMLESHAHLWGILTFSVNATFFVVSGGAGARVGPGPRAPTSTTAPQRHYIPKTPLQQQEIGGTTIPLPDKMANGYPHTTLGGKISETGARYRQSATFNGSWPSANGQQVPTSRVDWYHHGRPSDHFNPHQHPFYWGGSQWYQEKGPGLPFRY